MSSDDVRWLYKRAFNLTDLSGSYGTLWWRAGEETALVC